MSKKGNIILYIIIFLICIGIIIFALTYKKEIIPIESTELLKSERLCEILDENKVTIKYFTGDINYIEKETYVEITKHNGNCIDTIIILPAGTIRFFNVSIEDDNDE